METKLVTVINGNKKIRIICPICKSNKELEFPNSIINQSSQLTTVSINKGILCDHHFQMFVDQNFRIRGYQKVDFELKPEEKFKQNTSMINQDNDKDLFENLFLEGNYLEYKPSNKERLNRKMTLAEIYEEFWDVIDENNEEFQEFIIKDKRRS